VNLVGRVSEFSYAFCTVIKITAILITQQCKPLSLSNNKAHVCYLNVKISPSQICSEHDITKWTKTIDTKFILFISISNDKFDS